MTAVMLASMNGHLEVARLLLEAGAGKDAWTNCDCMMSLMFASEKGHSEVARLLLEAGADQDCCDNGGMTALMRPSRSGHSEIACLLLEAGADKDACSYCDRMTALMFTSERSLGGCTFAA